MTPPKARAPLHKRPLAKDTIRKFKDNPAPFTRWSVSDFLDHNLLARVLAKLAEKGLSLEDCEEALAVGRELVYKNALGHGYQRMGVLYAQYQTMRKTCQLMDVEGFDSFKAGPALLRGPTDRQFVQVGLEALQGKKRKQRRRMA